MTDDERTRERGTYCMKCGIFEPEYELETDEDSRCANCGEGERRNAVVVLDTDLNYGLVR